MTREERKRKEVRNWRARKITLYIVSLAVLVIGAIIMVQGVLSDPLKDTWKFITGFVICVAGGMLLMETYHWSLRNYLSKKRRKAR